MKRIFLSLAVFSGFVVSVCAADKPNIVLFLVDDMGWMDSGVYGSKYYETPNIDRLAQRALRFTDAYATPLCSPTRASILTGQYSSRHGILIPTGHLAPQHPGFKFLPDEAPPHRAVISPIGKNYLEPSQYTVAEALRDAGWKTAHVGKWHLGLTEPHWPEKQGFDVAVHAHPDAGPASYFSPYNFAKHQSYTNGPDGEYITDRLTDEAIAFVKANRDHPFLLHLWHHGLHSPWGHKEEYTKQFVSKKDPRGKQGNPIMASMLKSIDESLGRMLDTLDELKLTDNTIFIFFSDNGGNTYSNTPKDRSIDADAKAGGKKRATQLQDWKKWAGDLPPTNNDPLRDGKGTLYEGGTRVPLMIAWPRKIPANTQTEAVVHAVDLYPTILDLVGVKPSASQIIDGTSIAPVLRDPKAKLSREAIFNFFPTSARIPGGVWVRQGDWKLIRWFETTSEYPNVHELYNLREDRGETKNLAKQNVEKVKALDALIGTFLKETGALVPKPNPAYKKAAAN